MAVSCLVPRTTGALLSRGDLGKCETTVGIGGLMEQWDLDETFN